MALVLSKADLAFRDEVRRFLDAELSAELREAGRRSAGVFSDYGPGMQWFRILGKRGWNVPHWPVEWGGTGWSPVQHYLFASELAAADAPSVAPQGPRMVAPVLLAFGTAEQKAHYLPRIRSGEDYWAQGYSEPGSGSDLASLQCRAVRDGDHYVINGTKIWTTHAQYANKIFCLVRTDTQAKAQSGISFLLFDIGLPGITVRPIISISGDHELNQVFFDDVRVPVSALLGEENRGWTVAKYLLQHERGGSYSPMLRARLRRLYRARDAAFAGRAADDAERSDIGLKLADAECRIDAIEAMELRTLAAATRGETPNPMQPSIGKLLGTETKQRLTELDIQIAGFAAAARVDMAEAGQGALPLPEQAVFGMTAYLNDRAASIYAGTNEVQRNLIAAQLLGLRS
jgi:alkylation response protein AidB-like acyl-CoA dehydrogenase